MFKHSYVTSIISTIFNTISTKKQGMPDFETTKVLFVGIIDTHLTIVSNKFWIIQLSFRAAYQICMSSNNALSTPRLRSYLAVQIRPHQ